MNKKVAIALVLKSFSTIITHTFRVRRTISTRLLKKCVGMRLCRITTHQEGLGNGVETRTVQSTRKEPIHRATSVILQFSEHYQLIITCIKIINVDKQEYVNK